MGGTTGSYMGHGHDVVQRSSDGTHKGHASNSVTETHHIDHVQTNPPVDSLHKTLPLGAPAVAKKKSVHWPKYNFQHQTFHSSVYNRRPRHVTYTEYEMNAIRQELHDLHSELFQNQQIYTIMPSVRTVPETQMQTWKRKVNKGVGEMKGVIGRLSAKDDSAFFSISPRPSVDLRGRPSKESKDTSPGRSDCREDGDSARSPKTPPSPTPSSKMPSSPLSSPSASPSILKKYSIVISSPHLSHRKGEKEEEKKDKRSRSKSPSLRMFTDLAGLRSTKTPEPKKRDVGSIPMIVITAPTESD